MSLHFFCGPDARYSLPIGADDRGTFGAILPANRRSVFRTIGEKQSIPFYQQFDDGNRIVVWLTTSLDDVNGVLGHIPVLADTELHLVPIPAAASFGVFTAGHTTYSDSRCGLRVPTM